MKYHKNPPTITITEDDVELVADKVQDRGEDVVRATEAQREEIMEKLVEVHDILQRLQLNTMHHPTTQQTEKEQETSVQKEKEETVKTIVVSSDRFKVTQEMLEVDENTVQRLVKDMEHMELVLEKIPTKALYGLQASVMQEVQSRARVDATNLALDREVKEILQVTCEQIMLEKEEEKQHIDNLEKKIAQRYTRAYQTARRHRKLQQKRRYNKLRRPWRDTNKK
jgi:hypothetical protein